MQDLMPPINTQDSIFHDGDPTTGQLGTIVTALWLNNVQAATRDVQAEIKNVLAKAGMTPDPKKTNQLADAISQIVSSGNYASTAYVDNGLNKKIDKANISGVKGNDNDKVPSLNLFTTETGKLATKAELSAGLAGKQPTGDYVTKEALDNNLKLKLDKTSVVQNTGTSTTQVMSQDGATKSFIHLGQFGWGGVDVSYVENALTDSAISSFLSNTSTVSSIYRFNASTSYSFQFCPFIYAKTGNVFTALTASHTGSGVKVIGGYNAGDYVYNLLTDKNTSQDESGFLRKGTATALTTNALSQGIGQSQTHVMSQKATTDAIKSNSLGVNQSWKTASITLNTQYTNSTSKGIQIIVSANGKLGDSYTIRCEVDNLSVTVARSSNSGGTVDLSGSIIIPAGSKYRFLSNLGLNELAFFILE
ncbi:hypothetical protein [Providencia huaxiensis]|uniref:hypothetical protein n=1 Tax=Providencia huaxiensis TaxID=2027290 RepID=UPI0024AEE514|nr:hypothetical protein [Providencia huaxiensis]MDI7238749.1 hypothetical protein [Providencia huaxiensis]